MDEKELYYDLSKFEADAITTRSNFLLVFQSMLFAAAAVADISDSRTVLIPIWLIILLGFSSSSVWLYLNILTNQRFKIAIEKLKEKDARMKELLERCHEGNFFLKHGKVSTLMTYPLPILTGTAWLILLCKYFFL